MCIRDSSLAHVRGPRAVVPRPTYGDVVREVRDHLRRTVDRAVALGVPEERIIVDPGHDLNKNTRHTLEITRRLDEIATLGLPVLAAVSNKDFIGESLDRHRHERLPGSLAAAAASEPGRRSCRCRSRLSPMKSLFETAASTGSPRVAISSSRRVISRVCRVFLFRSWPGSTMILSSGTPSATARSTVRRRWSRTSLTTSP